MTTITYMVYFMGHDEPRKLMFENRPQIMAGIQCLKYHELIGTKEVVVYIPLTAIQEFREICD